MCKSIKNTCYYFPNFHLWPHLIQGPTSQKGVNIFNQVVKCIRTHPIELNVFRAVHCIRWSLHYHFYIVPMYWLSRFYPEEASRVGFLCEASNQHVDWKWKTMKFLEFECNTSQANDLDLKEFPIIFIGIISNIIHMSPSWAKIADSIFTFKSLCERYFIHPW